ncbi:MAG: hypothetical protein AB1714_20290 [Acidobacteriota bacterium]
MLVRRGLRPRPTPPDIPFSPDLDEAAADQLARQLDSYAFRLFLRGAIQRWEGFRPGETTRYLQAPQSRAYAEWLVKAGLASRLSTDRYRLIRGARSFGGTLEWYVARELRRRLQFDVASGLKTHAKGVGGDLDVVAAAEGKLVYIELKSSPPRNITAPEICAFFDRVGRLRPHVSLFVVDTALRLTDKILPMLVAELERRGGGVEIEPRRVERELWALTAHLYAVNARGDLISNISRAVAAGFHALAPAA